MLPRIEKIATTDEDDGNQQKQNKIKILNKM
jgi:hypothetical protein